MAKQLSKQEYYDTKWRVVRLIKKLIVEATHPETKTKERMIRNIEIRILLVMFIGTWSGYQEAAKCEKTSNDVTLLQIRQTKTGAGLSQFLPVGQGTLQGWADNSLKYKGRLMFWALFLV